MIAHFQPPSCESELMSEPMLSLDEPWTEISTPSFRTPEVTRVAEGSARTCRQLEAEDNNAGATAEEPIVQGWLALLASWSAREDMGDDSSDDQDDVEGARPAGSESSTSRREERNVLSGDADLSINATPPSSGEAASTAPLTLGGKARRVGAIKLPPPPPPHALSASALEALRLSGVEYKAASSSSSSSSSISNSNSSSNNSRRGPAFCGGSGGNLSPSPRSVIATDNAMTAKGRGNQRDRTAAAAPDVEGEGAAAAAVPTTRGEEEDAARRERFASAVSMFSQLARATTAPAPVSPPSDDGGATLAAAGRGAARGDGGAAAPPLAPSADNDDASLQQPLPPPTAWRPSDEELRVIERRAGELQRHDFDLKRQRSPSPPPCADDADADADADAIAVAYADTGGGDSARFFGRDRRSPPSAFSAGSSRAKRRRELKSSGNAALTTRRRSGSRSSSSSSSSAVLVEHERRHNVSPSPSPLPLVAGS